MAPLIPETAFCQTNDGEDGPCLDVVAHDMGGGGAAGAGGMGGDGGQGGLGGALSVLSTSSVGGGPALGAETLDPELPPGVPMGVQGPPWGLLALIVLSIGLVALAYRQPARDRE